MVFSSMLFLWIFLPLVLAAYYLSPRKIRNGILVFFSLLFYAWGEPIYILLMLCSVLVNFMGGIFMEDHKTHRKGILWGTVLINLGLLGYFKCFNFLAEIIGKILPGGLGNLSIPQVALPIGISFYTFQALSYVIDVYRGEVKAQRNFWYMLLYISFFPQLIAGPIVKYRDIAQQILERKETVEKFAAGVMRFCWGLGKKVLLANAFAEVVDDIFQYGPEAVSRKALWLGAVLYMLQIYYDFSGYSDMAVGLGKMFGFQFQENFDYPYVSGSVKEFWRRWHISLSSWFRDYVYIPLGGNRKGALCTYRNLLIVFFLTGMWHGAGIGFILWGLYHGLFLILERVWLGKKLEKLPGFVGWGYTMIVVFLGWILFRAEDFGLFCSYVKNLFVSHGGMILTSAYLDKKLLFLLIMGILFAGFVQKVYGLLREKMPGKFPENGVVTVPRIVASIAILWLCVMSLVNNSYNPFIYFRF